MSARMIETKEFVVNRCYGGFGLSKLAVKRLLELGYEIPEKIRDLIRVAQYDIDQLNYDIEVSIPRDHPLLIQVVRELGDKASGECSELEIVEVKVEYWIDSHDGMESVKGMTSYENY